MSLHTQLFRKVSLERLSSPEQLDLLMKVTSARAWIALAALCGLVLTSVLWGIFGNVPTKVSGSCILIRPGGTLEVVAPSNGRVIDISVEAGDVVQEGQIIARMDRNDASGQIRSVEAKLSELRAQEARLKAITGRSEREQQQYLRESASNLQSRIKSTQERAAAIENRAQVQEKLLEQGLITRQTLLATRMEAASAKQEILERQNDITQLAMRQTDSRKQVEGELGSLAIQINEAQRGLAGLVRSSDQATLVYSPYRGRVIEIRVGDGEIAAAGTPILTIEQTGASVDDLEVVIYLSPQDGKKVKPHMNVQVSPSTVKREEFGFMLGKVRAVAEFPSTFQGMMRVLKNEQLVHQLSSQTSPITAQADLTPSNDTVSKYRWSSPEGPPLRVESGTLCNATVTLKNDRPITLVIPLLRKFVDL
ncbi:NHLP bacteriocin system secretion protein [Caenimonas terrae]|uniref:NHLP bacteriocin system secretion protein n=1 Tax=Caenimonas terrae TaxID=696074 RepID=A0ABW0NCL4_9BURK